MVALTQVNRAELQLLICHMQMKWHIKLAIHFLNVCTVNFIKKLTSACGFGQ